MSKVGIVVTAFLEENRRYADLAIKSIGLLDYPKEKIELVIVSPEGYEHEGVRVIHPKGKDYLNGHAINLGIEAVRDCDYYLVLNDDVILTNESLNKLVEASRSISDRALIMPIGNDNQQRYLLNAWIPPRPYRYEDLAPHFDHLVGLKSPYPPGFILGPTLCLYAFLLPKSIYEAFGPLSECLEQNDVDYTLRIMDGGFLNAIALDAIVYHFGGVTADITISQQKREANERALMERLKNEPN